MGIKQQLVTVLQELELQKSMWEEKGEKVEECWRAWEQEQKQSQTQINEAKKLAVVNWWKAQTTETRSRQETQAKLRHTEQTVTDMREQVCHLQTSLKSAQERIAEYENSGRVLQIEKGTNTEREEVDSDGGTTVKTKRDVAVATDEVEDIRGTACDERQTQFQVMADGLLEALRRMEAMVSSTWGTAEQVQESEQRVCQVSMRMESISQRVEEALQRAADTHNLLRDLEVRMSEKPQTQSPDPRQSCDPGAEAIHLDSELKVGDRVEKTPCPVILEATEHPQSPMSGGSSKDGRGNTIPWEAPMGHPCQIPKPPQRLFQRERNSGSTLSSSRMTEFLTLSQRETPPPS
ncbi:myosin-9-like [Thalassophryne amazonica]|uniref:myosin-9-like n=1 Tax=Thalassophryne amazonica TaxID=390379 RepID=UPI001471CCE7|nr:myosin-9-like [Thalassophryne amazonica]